MYPSISQSPNRLPSLPNVEDFQDIIDQCAYIDYVMYCNRMPADTHLPLPPPRCTSTQVNQLIGYARSLYRSLSRRFKHDRVTEHEIRVLQEHVSVRALRLLGPVLFGNEDIPELP